MCMISGELTEVKNTKIFVAPLGGQDKGKQITVYANDVALSPNEKNGAMILPFPSIESPARIVDLSNFVDMFDKLHDVCFPAQEFPFNNSSSSKSSYSPQNLLEVFDVGSYSVSIAENIHDLKRIDHSKLIVASDLLEFMSKKYSEKFGFVICMLKPEASYHPFGYVHDMPEKNKLFIPTMHYHNHSHSRSRRKAHNRGSGGSVPWDDLFGSSGSSESQQMPVVRQKVNEHMADFDHDIYIWNGIMNEQVISTRTTMSNVKDFSIRGLNEFVSECPKKCNLVFADPLYIQAIKIGSTYKKNHDCTATVY